MTVIIDGYEVEIKAKKIGKKNVNIKDTMHVLSEIEGWGWCSARHYEEKDYELLSEERRDDASNIHKTLASYGFFDNIRRAN